MTKARIIDGKAIAADLQGRVAGAAAWLKEDHGLTPGLAVVLVGEHPASQIYVRNKSRQTVEAGMESFAYTLPTDTTQAELLSLVSRLNADSAVHGILVQLPLPDQIDPQPVLDAIDPAKDVDGFHPVNVGGLWSGRTDALVSCTPVGCLILIREAVGDLVGKRAVVLGRSNIVGKPVAALLLAAHCTVTLAHSRTRDLPALCREADILVVAVGRQGLVQGDWIKPGACVIDVGMHRIPAPERGEGKTRLAGDVDFGAAVEVAGTITPVPGGVGPMTIACLLRNTVIAACGQAGIDVPDM